MGRWVLLIVVLIVGAALFLFIDSGRSPVGGSGLPKAEFDKVRGPSVQKEAGPPVGMNFDSLSNKALKAQGYVARWGCGSLVREGGSYGYSSGGSSKRYRGVLVSPLQKGPRLWERKIYQPLVRVKVGPKASLELRRMRVYVEVDGPRVRTVVDHIFYNPYNKGALEGRFVYNLPSGASVCYYGMFLGTGGSMPEFFGDGQEAALRELLKDGIIPERYAEIAAQNRQWGEFRVAKVVPRESALEAYEKIVRRGIDPAVLRRGSENKFIGRVFPIRSKAYNRIILAYEETLPFVDGYLVYRFCFPKATEAEELSIRISTATRNFTDFSFKTTGVVKKQNEGGGSEPFYAEFSGEEPGSVTLTFKPTDPNKQVVAGKDGKGERYFYARLYPYVPTEEKEATPHRAVFVFDTSLSESPDRFGVAVRLAEAILNSDKEIKEFAVLLFDVGARWLRIGRSFWTPNISDGRAAFTKALDKVLLEGATNLSAALEALSDASRKHPSKLPVNIHLFTNGYVTWGQTDLRKILPRFWRSCRWDSRFFCYRTGIGAENVSVLWELTRRGGGVFKCMSRDAIKEASVAHKHHCFVISSIRAKGVKDLLVAGGVTAVYPGGSIEVVGRPTADTVEITFEGTIAGHSVTRTFTINAKGESRLAARAWAQVAIASLERLNDPKVRKYIIALAQRFNISSRYTNFLVLETDRDYKIYNVDTERRVFADGDIADYIKRHNMVLGLPVPARKRFEGVLAYLERRKKFTKTKMFKHLCEFISDKVFETPSVNLGGVVMYERDVPKEYLVLLKKSKKDPDVYGGEAGRRYKGGDIAGAVRSLSCIVELYQGSNEATRYVAYELMRMGCADLALALYLDLLESRPFDPQLWRETALAAAEAKRWLLSALLFEVLINTNWQRFRSSMRIITLGEYKYILKKALKTAGLIKQVKAAFENRLEEIHHQYAKVAGSAKRKVDFRVTIYWNTDNCDVDLWVIEPTGEKCYYSHKRTKIGGVLLDDVTDGYGPERYELQKAHPGEYRVLVHYFSAPRTAVGGRTRVTVIVQQYPDTPREQTKRFVVTLHKTKQAVKVCTVKFK